jgi:hypothetical protein
MVKRIVDNVRNKTYSSPGSAGSVKGIIDSQQDAGGWPDLASQEPPVSTAGDGIPYDWKVAHHLNPAEAQANGKELSTAYDNIEVYINSLIEQIVEGGNEL